MVGVIGGITISWLEGLKQASRVNESSSFVSTDIFSFDCAYASDSSSSGIQKIFLKTILSNLLILIYFTIAIIFWTLYFLVRRKKIWRNNEFLLNILISIFVISFNQQVNLISLNLSIFECDNIYRNDTPLYHMKSDYDIQCWTGDHLLYSLVIALPMLLFWAIIFPLIILRKIYRFKDQLEDPPQKLHKYAFFLQRLQEAVLLLGGGHLYQKVGCCFGHLSSWNEEYQFPDVHVSLCYDYLSVVAHGQKAISKPLE